MFVITVEEAVAFMTLRSGGVWYYYTVDCKELLPEGHALLVGPQGEASQLLCGRDQFLYHTRDDDLDECRK